jgi:hypothetical protein
MSEKSPQESPLDLDASPVPLPATERINMEVLRQIAMGNELESWQVQVIRRLQWMVVPLLVGVGCGVFLLNARFNFEHSDAPPSPVYMLKSQPTSSTYIGKKKTPIGPNTPGGKQQ